MQLCARTLGAKFNPQDCSCQPATSAILCPNSTVSIRDAQTKCVSVVGTSFNNITCNCLPVCDYFAERKARCLAAGYIFDDSSCSCTVPSTNYDCGAFPTCTVNTPCITRNSSCVQKGADCKMCTSFGSGSPLHIIFSLSLLFILSDFS